MIATLFLVGALVCFLLDTFGVAARVNLTAAGLACLALSMIVAGYA